MKKSAENSKKYPGLEQLSTAELEELLRQDYFTSEDDDASILLISEIMEVIDSREPQETLPIDENTAWETFLARNVTHTFNEGSSSASEEKELPHISNTIPFSTKKKPAHRRRLRRVVSFVAVFCLLTCFFTVSATGKEAVKNLIEWSTHTFSFIPSGVWLSRLDSANYDQIKNKTAELTTLPVLPTQYPKGAELVQIEENSTFTSTNVDFVFSSVKGGFSIGITVYPSIYNMPAFQYEKDPEPPESYIAYGIPHYIVKNMDTYTAIWRNENVECFIQGHLSIDELKSMIDSIYT